MYDQYEFAIPFDHMIPCWEAFIALFKQNPQMADDLLVAMCVRFLREESAFLSMSYGGPHLYINFDNYDVYNRSKRALWLLPTHSRSISTGAHPHSAMASLSTVRHDADPMLTLKLVCPVVEQPRGGRVRSSRSRT